MTLRFVVLIVVTALKKVRVTLACVLTLMVIFLETAWGKNLCFSES